MGHIIADIKTTDETIRTEDILRHIGLEKRDALCERCVKTPAKTVFVSGRGDIHLISAPCTRVVIGIHPETRVILEQEMNADVSQRTQRQIVSFGFGDSYYFCEQCIGWSIPELLAQVTPELQEGVALKRDPIHDSGKPYVKEKGCWITVTEFPLTRLGRFLDYQTDFQNLVRILNTTKLIGDGFLKPYL